MSHAPPPIIFSPEDGERAPAADLPRDAAFDAVLKAAFEDFTTRERNFFLNLSPSARTALDPDAPQWYFACHSRHYMEFLLTMKGVQPCMLIAHDTEKQLFSQMVEECLKPAIQAQDLGNYGFILRQITHSLATTSHSDQQDGWIFADIRSALWQGVEAILLTPHPGQLVQQADVAKLLGRPAAAGHRAVTYKDTVEQGIIDQQVAEEVCCVDAVEYSCGDGSQAEWDACLQHMARCSLAAQSVGRNLAFDMSHHPLLERYLDKLQDGS